MCAFMPSFFPREGPAGGCPSQPDLCPAARGRGGGGAGTGGTGAARGAGAGAGRLWEEHIPACAVGEAAAGRPLPHLGFQLRAAAHQELPVGGSQNLRFYWKEFVNEVDVLVFVVDSADRLRLQRARQELHKLLDKDPDLPVVVVANKQDLSEAMSVMELQRELGLQAINSQREVFLLAASIAPAGPGFNDPGTVHIWRLLLQLLS
nr:ADP-ribosylation factor-like protein 10 isoform X2 [Loxodonta africana]